MIQLANLISVNEKICLILIEIEIKIKIKTILFIFYITKNSLHPDLYLKSKTESYLHFDQSI